MKKSILDLGKVLHKTDQRYIKRGYNRSGTQCDYVLYYIKRTHQWLSLTVEQCQRETY